MDTFIFKDEFRKEKEEIFSNPELINNPFKFCLIYSNLIDSFISKVFENENPEFIIAASGGYGRRELSPYSDIDLMFIADNAESLSRSEALIVKYITILWDAGIEVSHTTRIIEDIEKFFDEDLHAFTQFFETRLLIGNSKLFDRWNNKIGECLTDENKKLLVTKFIEDNHNRYKKFGDSPKVLEPNIKYTAGGLRDLQAIEWIYSILSNQSFTTNSEITQTESFLFELANKRIINSEEIKRLINSYQLLLLVRNRLHLLYNIKTDRFEFQYQERIAKVLDAGSWPEFMKTYFEAAMIINRFTKTMLKSFIDQVSNPLPDAMLIRLDDDFQLLGNVISVFSENELSISDIMQAFYYRGIYDARFDDNLRSLIIRAVVEEKRIKIAEAQASLTFRDILRMERNVTKTLVVMNELGMLGAFIPEFKELIGFFQPGVYHCYTADEHTLVAIKNLEELRNSDSRLGLMYIELLEKDILFMAVLLHDIAKPISISGHEIIGAELTNTIMERLSYDEKEITLVQFLVKNHLLMEQIAFRRDINDPQTLNNFVAIFPSVKALDMLLLLTFADLSAVNSMVWTQWKNDQLFELYRLARVMIIDEISGEQLLFRKTVDVLKGKNIKDKYVKHIEAMDDISYINQFTEEEIAKHVHEIEKGSKLAVFFKENQNFTNITVLSTDSFSILARLCGVLAINDLNIHDARIFTRKDGIIMDSFNVTDFRNHSIVAKEKYEKIERDLRLCLSGEMQINIEFKNYQSRWRRLENKLFRKKEKIKIRFEEHDKYTIIDVSAPDRLGLLYQITKSMTDVGLNIYFAKISTKGDDVIDSFYTLDRNLKKILPHDYEMIRIALTEAIEEML